MLYEFVFILKLSIRNAKPCYRSWSNKYDAAVEDRSEKAEGICQWLGFATSVSTDVSLNSQSERLPHVAWVACNPMLFPPLTAVCRLSFWSPPCPPRQQGWCSLTVWSARGTAPAIQQNRLRIRISNNFHLAHLRQVFQYEGVLTSLRSNFYLAHLSLHTSDKSSSMREF